ncbi:MAG: hypothetical protein IPO51_06435 [Dehalococcoidia bacterium]|nr:hypothetical protein [Dehalococcoidia bacterium]
MRKTSGRRASSRLLSVAFIPSMNVLGRYVEIFASCDGRIASPMKISISFSPFTIAGLNRSGLFGASVRKSTLFSCFARLTKAPTSGAGHRIVMETRSPSLMASQAWSGVFRRDW